MGRSARASLLLLGLCVWIAALLGGSVSAAAGAGAREVILSQFKLKGTNGYKIDVSGVRGGGRKFPPTGVVIARRGPLGASYEVPLISGDGVGIHADLDAVGAVALNFKSRKRTVDRPEKRCVWIFETGAFEGSFRFAGERGYTSAKATSVEGKVTRLPNGFCGFGDDRTNPGLPDLFRMTTLAARTQAPSGVLEFHASEIRPVPGIDYGASLEERRGAMKIVRSAGSRVKEDGILGGGERLDSILIDPPSPFQGTAQFQQAAGARPSWTGSLSVAFPGTSSIALAGPTFAARLCPNVALLGKCRVGGKSGAR